MIVLSAAILLMWVLLAGLVGQMAERKGRSNLHWYLFSLFWSPLVGFLVVALLPSAADLTPVEYTWCRYCLRTVRVRTDTCPYCHADLTGKGGAGKKAA